jgi:hypothetical protein
MLNLTRLKKDGGPLTKCISLDANGKLRSDSNDCRMAHGWAERLRLADMGELGAVIGGMPSNEAIALGTLHPRLPDRCEVYTKQYLARLNGSSPHIICRSRDNIDFVPGARAVALLDFDSKQMPSSVRARFGSLGGFIPSLQTVIHSMGDAATVLRASTSSGIYRTDDGTKLPGSDGLHLYLEVTDGPDIQRFLKALNDRLWLNGLGWMAVGKAGAYLPRSIVDAAVGQPERIAFEGAPPLSGPIAQDAEARRPKVRDGAPLDTRMACPDLTTAERAQLRMMEAQEKQRVKPDADKARMAFVDEQVTRHVARGYSRDQALSLVELQCRGILLPSVELPFDDDLTGKTVGDVLANPLAFSGETLADPNEGVDYGRGKAMVMRRADGSVWINTFARGHGSYELKYDLASVKMAVSNAGNNDRVDTFIRCALNAELREDELASAIKLTADLTGPGMVKAIGKAYQDAVKKRAALEEEEGRNRRLSERTDKRVMLEAPRSMAPWLPVVRELNEVLGKSADTIPPMRNLTGTMTTARLAQVPRMRRFSAKGANAEGSHPDEDGSPEQMLLLELSSTEVAELIERHVEYVNKRLDEVHLDTSYVGHFVRRARDDRDGDAAIPIVSAVATLPIVFADGSILAQKEGLDRNFGIVFNIAPELVCVLPNRARITADDIRNAMNFLTDVWLCDVQTSYAGKCALISSVMEIIERSQLSDRPMIWVTAGRRGEGKTTTLRMIVMAATGMHAAASAWTFNEEERRKAILAYFMAGVAYILWDNIPRGARITCPHIERSCTSEWYTDRILGVSRNAVTSCSAVHLFCGNNVGAKGDSASRSLEVKLSVQHAHPENRNFTHADAVAWTEEHRAEILKAIYTIMLGNPALDLPRDAPMPTRFKDWQRLIGSAIEYGAKRCVEAGVIGAEPVEFRKMFIDQEQDAEQLADSPAYALTIVEEIYASLKKDEPHKHPNIAAGVATAINMAGDGVSNEMRERAETLAHWLFGEKGWQPGKAISSKSVGRKLVKQVDNIVSIPGSNEAIVLRSCKDPSTQGAKSGFIYWVERIKDPDPAEPQPDGHDAKADGHDQSQAPGGIPEIAVGGPSFAVGDKVDVRDDNGGLVYQKPVPILRFEHYEDGFYYAVLDTEETARYHRVETLVKGADPKPDGGI